MGKVIYAEESLLHYLKTLTNENSNAVGLIIGQASKSRDYVVHLARTAEQNDESCEDVDSVDALTFKTVRDIQESVIADQAKHVTKMLPGGFCVLGVFVCSSSNIFSEPSSESALKKILLSIKKTLLSEAYPTFSNEGEKVLLHYNPDDNKYACKALEMGSSVAGAFKPVEWKFQNGCTEWCQIVSNFDMNWPYIGGKTSQQLKTQLKNFLMEIKKLLESAVIVIDGKVQNLEASVESVMKGAANKKTNSGTDCLKASIYTPLQPTKLTDDIMGDDDISIIDCDVELNLIGVLKSQIFITPKGTVEEVVAAVKQDIVRSLAARMELHWDSLIEEEYGSPEERHTIHEPPRRVSVNLPNSRICFTDYIFPGEGPEEVIATFKELLDINISGDNVDDEFELLGDPLDFCGKAPTNSVVNSSDDMLTNSFPFGFIIAAISFAVVLVGIALALQLQSSNRKASSNV